MNRVFIWNENAASSVGPFDLDMFLSLVEEGAVDADTLVAADGERTWTHASEHPVTASCVGENAWAPPSRRSAGGTRSVAPFARPGLGARTATSSDDGRVVHSLYDPDYELDILELNPGNRRRFKDFAIVAGALNGLVLAGALALPMSPVVAAVLLTFFIGGNVGLSWLFGVVMG